jgi:hypothetical protein
MRSSVRISSWSFAGFLAMRVFPGMKPADQYTKDAAMPENEAELPPHADRCTSHSHVRRCTTEAKWKRSNDWFQLQCGGKKILSYGREPQPEPWVISRIEKSTAQVYFLLNTGHALIGPCLKRVQRTHDDTCWWCLRGVVRNA